MKLIKFNLKLASSWDGKGLFAWCKRLLYIREEKEEMEIEEVRAAKPGSIIMINNYSGYKIPEGGILKDEKGREFVPGNKQKAYIREREGQAYVWLFAPISQNLKIKEIISPEEWLERKKKLEPTREQIMLGAATHPNYDSHGNYRGSGGGSVGPRH